MNINPTKNLLLAAMTFASFSGNALSAETHKIDPVTHRVKQIVEQDKLVSAPQCVDYFLTKNIKPGVDLIDVLEKHNSQCGGDPQTHPRLFSVYVDQKTQRMASDVADPSGVGSFNMLFPPEAKTPSPNISQH